MLKYLRSTQPSTLPYPDELFAENTFRVVYQTNNLHLIKILCAIDRYLAICGRAAFDCVLDRINGLVKDARIEDAVFISMSEAGLL